MKDEKWMESMEKLGAVRLFSSLYVKKSRKGALTSAQEIDLLFRTALAKEPLTPLDLSYAMGIRKNAVSRLIEDLTKKHLIQKIECKEDKRSYYLKITESGKKELDDTYYYYMEPFYELQKNLGEEDFDTLMRLIHKANDSAMDKK